MFLSLNAEKQEDESVLESYIGSFQMRYIQIKYANKMNTVSIRVPQLHLTRSRTQASKLPNEETELKFLIGS